MLVELRRLARSSSVAALEAQVATLTQQLGARMQESATSTGHLTTLVHAQLRDANSSLGALAERLGRIDEATRQLERVGASIAGLEQIFASPKLRGNFGELSLERLLADILPAQNVSMQYRLDTRGVIVDCVVRTGDGRLVPIDSKFPLESFVRLAEADFDDTEALRREFHRAVRARIDEIARKYISPEDGTLDFALMFVPAEGVYYELMRGGADVFEYARERRIILCSPNTLYAYLQSVLMGVKSAEIARRAAEISAALEHLRQDVNTAGMHVDRAATQMRYASSNLDAGRALLDRIDVRIANTLREEETQQRLEVEG